VRPNHTSLHPVDQKYERRSIERIFRETPRCSFAETCDHWEQAVNGARVFAVATNYKKGWRALLRRAGINNFQWHDMRHRFASRLVQRGVPLNTVRDLLGHTPCRRLCATRTWRPINGERPSADIVVCLRDRPCLERLVSSFYSGLGFSLHQAVEFVFRNGGNQPSLETCIACLFARRVLDAAGERDEAQRSPARVLPQRVSELIGVVRKCYIQENDSRRTLFCEQECARGSTNDANTLVSLCL
jgi:hypothetical protein